MHPVIVAQLLWHIGERDETMLAAALLRDVCEDTDTPLAVGRRDYPGKLGESRESLVRAVSLAQFADPYLMLFNFWLLV